MDARELVLHGLATYLEPRLFGGFGAGPVYYLHGTPYLPLGWASPGPVSHTVLLQAGPDELRVYYHCPASVCVRLDYGDPLLLDRVWRLLRKLLKRWNKEQWRPSNTGLVRRARHGHTPNLTAEPYAPR